MPIEKKLPVALALFAFLCLAFAGAVQAGPKTPQKKVSLLYVLDAKSGKLSGKGASRQLTLSGTARNAIWFSDRPGRSSGSLPSAGLARSWAGFGFAEDPPNAALVYADPSGTERTAIVELRGPRAGKGSLSFAVRILKPASAGANLAQHARNGDRKPARKLRDATLFIDDTSAPEVDFCIMQPYADCPGSTRDFNEAYLPEVDLTGANLAESSLFQVNLYGASLVNANLTSVNIENSTLEFANFTGANLSGANVTTTMAGAANFTNANLTNANFEYAEIANASFKGATVAGANFKNTHPCNTTMPNGSVDNSGCGFP